jgi:hypothetical protein
MEYWKLITGPGLVEQCVPAAPHGPAPRQSGLRPLQLNLAQGPPCFSAPSGVRPHETACRPRHHHLAQPALKEISPFSISLCLRAAAARRHSFIGAPSLTRAFLSRRPCAPASPPSRSTPQAAVSRQESPRAPVPSSSSPSSASTPRRQRPSAVPRPG